MLYINFAKQARRASDHLRGLLSAFFIPCQPVVVPLEQVSLHFFAFSSCSRIKRCSLSSLGKLRKQELPWFFRSSSDSNDSVLWNFSPARMCWITCLIWNQFDARLIAMLYQVFQLSYATITLNNSYSVTRETSHSYLSHVFKVRKHRIPFVQLNEIVSLTIRRQRRISMGEVHIVIHKHSLGRVVSWGASSWTSAARSGGEICIYVYTHIYTESTEHTPGGPVM